MSCKVRPLSEGLEMVLCLSGGGRREVKAYTDDSCPPASEYWSSNVTNSEGFLDYVAAQMDAAFAGAAPSGSGQS